MSCASVAESGFRRQQEYGLADGSADSKEWRQVCREPIYLSFRPSAGVSPADDDGPADADVEHRGRAVPSVGVSRAEAETRAGLEGGVVGEQVGQRLLFSRGQSLGGRQHGYSVAEVLSTSPSRRACRVTLIAAALTCRQLTRW